MRKDFLKDQQEQLEKLLQKALDNGNTGTYNNLLKAYTEVCKLLEEEKPIAIMKIPTEEEVFISKVEDIMHEACKRGYSIMCSMEIDGNAKPKVEGKYLYLNNILHGELDYPTGVLKQKE